MSLRKRNPAMRLISILMCACVLLSLITNFPISIVAPEKASAAAATKDNTVLFKVTGTVTGGAVQYSIAIEDIFAQNYQSFTVTYPKELSIQYKTALTGTWTIGSSSSSTSTTTNFIIRSGSRSATDLKADLEKIYFTLTTTDVFPPEGSKVSIQASPTKTTAFQDTEGYVHYYTFVPFEIGTNGDPVAGATGSALLKNKSWWEAYNLAHNATMQDPRFPDDPSKKLHGYLATITSLEEQIQVYSAIAEWSGWLGGTRQVLKTGTARIQDNGAQYYDADSGTVKVRGTAIADIHGDGKIYTGTTGTAVTIGDYYIFTIDQNKWYWADGPEAWTVTNTTTTGFLAGGPAYQYYPQGMTTVPANGWSIYDSRTHVYTYWGTSDNPLGPDLTLSAGKSFVTDPNRNKPIGPLEFYNNHVYASGTDHAIRSSVRGLKDPDDNSKNEKIVYSNWNNPLSGTAHVYDANKNYAGKLAGSGAEPNGTTSEYCLQFAYPSGTVTITAANSATGVAVSTTRPDTWNDYAGTNTNNLYGYFIEFGGYPGDPMSDELGGGTVESTSTVELQMPIMVTYRSTVQTDVDTQGNPIYRQITSMGTTYDRVITYETYLPFTAVRLDQGTAVQTPPITSGQTGYRPPVPATIPGYTAYGYQFIGTQADRDNLTTNAAGDVAGFHSPTTQRVIFQYKPDTVTVNFDPNFTGATAANVSPATKTVEYDTPYGALATATRRGYDFKGWFTQATGGTEVTAKIIVSRTDTHTLYAHWEEKKPFTVYYDLDGGNISGASTFGPIQNLQWNTLITLPANPTKTDYSFIGWNVTDNGTKQGVTASDKYSDLAESDSLPSIELQAQWVPLGSATVIYRANGGTPAPNDANGNTSMTVTFPAITRAGYTFGGWKLVDSGGGSTGAIYQTTDSGTIFNTITSGAYIVLEAQWTAKTYTVNYDGNGIWNNSVLDPLPGSYSPAPLTNVGWGQNTLVPPTGGNPTWSRHIFMGWNTAADGTGVNVTVNSTYSTLVADDTVSSVTLYAQWTAERSYFVRYDLNGGKIGSDTTIADMKPVYLDTASLLPSGTVTPPTGYNFATWNVIFNGSKAGVNATDTFGGLATNPNDGYIVLQAAYSPKSNLTVTYNLNGGTSAVPPNKTGVMWTQSHLLPIADPTRATYVFVGWSVNSATGPSASASDSFGDLVALVGLTDATTSITLYARWAEAGKYTVSYNLNGGSQPSTAITDVTLVDDTNPGTGSNLYGYQKSVPAPIPVAPTGYTFSYWELEDNGYYQSNSSKTAASNGSTPYSYFAYNANSTGTGAPDYAKRIKLRAVYAEKTDFIVKYDWNYGTTHTVDTVNNIHWTGSGLVPHSATQAGKTLIGWTTDAAGLQNFVLAGNVYRDLVGGVEPGDKTLTLYAQWEDASFFVRYDLDGGSAPAGSASADYSQKTVGFDDTGLVHTAVIPEPTKLGYRFVKWIVSEYPNPSNSTAANDVNDTHSFRILSAANAPYITIKAVWSEITDYVVNYDLNGGKYDGNNTIAKQENLTWRAKNLLPGGIVGYDSSKMAKPGYTFVGWKLSKIGSNTLATPEPAAGYVIDNDTYGGLVTVERRQDEITLQAQWTEKATYTINYNFNFPSGVGAANKIGNEPGIAALTNLAWTASGLNTAPQAPATGDNDLANRPIGYRFVGWFTQSTDGTQITSTTTYNSLCGNEEPTSTPVLYAHWEARTYTVTYVPGSVTISGATNDENGNAPGTYNAWYYNDATDTIPGGSGAGATSSTNQTRTNITWAQTDGIIIPIRWLYINARGYNFAKWYVADNGVGGSNTDTIVGGSYTFGSRAANDLVTGIIIQGEWNKSFAVFYDLASGSYVSPGYTDHVDYYNLRTDAVTIRTAPTRAGYSFTGWKLTMIDAGTVSGSTYTAGQTIGNFDYLTTIGQNVTLTAQWTENPNVTINYTVVTKNNAGATQTTGNPGGTVSVSTQYVPPATGIAGSTAAANPGYDFIGWYAASDTTFATSLGTVLAFSPSKNSDGLNVAGSYVALFKEKANVNILYSFKTYSIDGATEQTASNGGSISSTSQTLAPATGTANAVTASANNGYRFVGWFLSSEPDTNLSDNASFTPSKDSTAGTYVTSAYIAVFQENAVGINYQTATFASNGATAQSPNNKGGSVSSTQEGSGSFPAATGNAAGSTATANSGYTFVGWFLLDAGGVYTGTPLSTSASYIPSKVSGLNVSATYVAVFNEQANVTINYITKTNDFDGTALADSAGGNVNSASESVAPVTGSATGSTATASSGYHFDGWYLSTDTTFMTKLSASAAYTPQPTSGVYTAATYVALFVENGGIEITYAAKTRKNDGTTLVATGTLGGSVTPTSQTIAPATGTAGSAATANAGYHLVGWFAATDTTFTTSLGTSATFNPAKSGGLNVAGSYVALFEENAPVTITYAPKTRNSATDDLGGSVTVPSQTLAPVTGTAASTAIPNTGYRFVGWYEATDTTYTTIICTTAAISLSKPYASNDYIALFEKLPLITVKKDDEIWVNHGKEITVKLNDAYGDPTGDFITDIANLPYGEYTIYADGFETGVKLTVDASETPAVVDYYTITYRLQEIGAASGSAISATYNGSAISSGAIVLAGGDLEITVTGNGATEYEYRWSTGVSTDSYAENGVSAKTDVLCQIKGINYYYYTIYVVDDDNSPLENAEIDIVQSGASVLPAAPGSTNTAGKYGPIELAPGFYNVIVTYTDSETGREVHATKLIEVVANEDGETTVVLYFKRGLLETEFTQDDDVPTIAAGDLNEIYDPNTPRATEPELGFTDEDYDVYFNGGEILITLEATEVDTTDPVQEQHESDIKDEIILDELEYAFDLDLSAYKYVTEYGSSVPDITQLQELNVLIKIFIELPLEHQGQTGYAVYRYHGDAVERIPLSPVKNNAGEYFEISEDGTTLILTVKKFSVYAVAYMQAAREIIVTLVPNGGSLAATQEEENVMNSGDTLILMEPARSGYTFIGWNDREDGTGNDYPVGTIPFYETTTLYAQWQQNPSPPPPPPPPPGPGTTDPQDPTDPADPTDPTDPSNPTDPSDPSDPTDPTDPTDPSNPTDPTDPSNPTNPSDPGGTTQPPQPSAPGNTVTPGGDGDHYTELDSNGDPVGEWTKQPDGTWVYTPNTPEPIAPPPVVPPKTGDYSGFTEWLALLVISGISIIEMFRRKKRRAE